MIARERIQKTIAYERPDRIPVHEDFWEDTLTAWHGQGLPGDVQLFPESLEVRQTPDSYFDFDIQRIYLDTSPRFEMEVLRRNPPFYTFRDRWGYVATKPEGASGSIDFESTPTQSREDWNRLRSRLVLSGDLAAPARMDDRMYFEHWTPYPSWSEAGAKFDLLHQTGRYILCMNYGPWEATWRHRDLKNLLMDIALDPGWVHEMAQAHLELTLDVLRRSLDEGIRPDGYLMVDDVGSSHGPLMSPAMWDEVLGPVVGALGDFLREHHIDFWVHSCGDAEPMFDRMIEYGVQVMNPVQVSAGLDICALQKKYHRRLAFYGNIDAHLFGGARPDLDRALERRVRAFRDGGWICHSDHSVPPTMSLDDFRWMLDRVRTYSEMY